MFRYAGWIWMSALCACAAEVTFYKDVLPILQKHCQECHRPGEVGPMPLLTYKDVRPWATAIKEAVRLGNMPPWFADPSVGHFRNDRSLSQNEVHTLSRVGRQQRTRRKRNRCSAAA